METDSKHMHVTIESLEQKHKPSRHPSGSLFSVANGQSLRSQLSDAALVLSWIIRTTLQSSSPTKFAVQYVLDPKLKNDRFVAAFGLPALSETPRVLSAAPDVRSSAGPWTYQGEQTASVRRKVINVASYNYLGFVKLEERSQELLEYALRSLPLANNKQSCDDPLIRELGRELMEFTGMQGCVLTASGYAINLVAFPAMAASCPAGSVNGSREPLIFVMDSESHSSMFMGAYIACASTCGRVLKFKHNDAADLEAKLKDLRRLANCRTAMRNVWVAVEGLYSMDGTAPPLRKIITLKREYQFRVYIDEAHSLFAIGRTGRGAIEHCRDEEVADNVKELMSVDDVDLLGGTMSKSLASVGGFVLGHEEMTSHIEARVREMDTAGGSKTPTTSLIRTLQILRAPQLMSQRLSHLHRVSSYVATQLRAKGYCISTIRGGPFVAIILDTVSRVLRFLRVGRERGLLCCGAAYPAAPRGAPRIRLSLTGAHSWADADEILRLIDDISGAVGVKGSRSLPLQSSNVAVDTKANETVSGGSGDHITFQEKAASSLAANTSIMALCPAPMDSNDSIAQSIRKAGIDAFAKYGLGAAGPRWMYGSFEAHMSLEALLNNTITRLASSIKWHIGGPGELSTTLFTDANVGLMSITSVSMESLSHRRTKKGERHIVLLPTSASLGVKEGAVAVRSHKSTQVLQYDELVPGLQQTGNECDRSIEALLRSHCRRSRKTHITVHFDVSCPTQGIAETTSDQATDAVGQSLASIIAIKPLTLTLLVSDDYMFPTSFASTQGIISRIAALVPRTVKVEWLIFSPLATIPHLTGLQGAFCTGSRRLIEKIQFLGPGVMYSAMMPPVTAALAEEGIRMVLRHSNHEN